MSGSDKWCTWVYQIHINLTLQRTTKSSSSRAAVSKPEDASSIPACDNEFFAALCSVRLIHMNLVFRIFEDGSEIKLKHSQSLFSQIVIDVNFLNRNSFARSNELRFNHRL